MPVSDPTARVSSDPIAIVGRFLEIHRYLNKYSKDIVRQFGVSGRKLAALRYARETGGATIGGLSEYLHISLSAASELASKLEELGFAQRVRDTEDNRVVRLVLTPAGEQLIADAPLGGVGLLRERLKALPEAEREAIAVALEKLASLIGVDQVDL